MEQQKNIKKVNYKQKENKPQTNFEKITESVETLAEILIQSEWMEGAGTIYITPDRDVFRSQEEAKQHTIEWLNNAYYEKSYK